MLLKLYLYEMGKRSKILLKSLGVFILLLSIGMLIAKYTITSKIEGFLSNSLPDHVLVQYEDIDFGVLSGSLTMTYLKITSKGKTTDSINMTSELTSVKICDVSYWNYFFNDRIVINSIELFEPTTVYYHNKTIESKYYQSSMFDNLKQSVDISSFKILNGELYVFDVETDSLKLSAKQMDFNISDIHLDKKTIAHKLPFNYKNYNATFNNLFYSLNDFDNLEVERSEISKEKSTFNNLKLHTKYSKYDLSKIISVERDHIDLNIPSIEFYQQDFGFHKDSVFYFSCPKVKIQNPVSNIHRNKLVTDDVSINSLYSKMLRDLTIDLTLSEVLIVNGEIDYSEKVKPENSAGHISFNNINATITNLSNTYTADKKTIMNIEALFMKTTPLKADWSFDVNDAQDRFVFKADLGKFYAQDLNLFTEPNLNIRMEGALYQTYFSINGNVNTSTVDLKTNYDDFKVTVLNKDGTEKNRLLTTVVNLFIKKSSKEDDDGFREGFKNDVERDKTKSVFNFLWLNAKAGLLSALAGDGKRD